MIAVLLAIRKMVSAIPLWVYAALISMVYGFYLGHSRMAEKFEKYKQDQVAVVKAAESKSAEITTQTVIQYVDRIQVVHEKGEAIVTKVPVYVPRNVCVLPPGFRSVLDAAASGNDLPDTPGEPDAVPKATSETPREPR